MGTCTLELGDDVRDGVAHTGNLGEPTIRN
jgi:hypothetical protein